jgi:hypothetical protein
VIFFVFSFLLPRRSFFHSFRLHSFGKQLHEASLKGLEHGEWM